MVFGSLTVLFVLLAIRDWTGATGWYATLVGWEGIFTGFSALYLAAAEMLKDGYGRDVLPIGETSKPSA